MESIQANENTIGNILAGLIRDGITQAQITFERVEGEIDHSIEITITPVSE